MSAEVAPARSLMQRVTKSMPGYSRAGLRVELLLHHRLVRKYNCMFALSCYKTIASFQPCGS
jgi:hypothetical protein